MARSGTDVGVQNIHKVNSTISVILSANSHGQVWVVRGVEFFVGFLPTEDCIEGCEVVFLYQVNLTYLIKSLKETRITI